MIREMSWRDIISFPYRLRERILRPPEVDADVDPMAASSGYITRLIINAISFAPTMAAMAIPVIGMCWWTGRWPAWRNVGTYLWDSLTLVALVLFTVYVTFCALHELVRMWRRVVRTLS